MAHLQSKPNRRKGKITHRKYGTLSLLFVPHRGTMKTLRLLHYKGLFFTLTAILLISGTFAVMTAIRINRENIALRQTIIEDTNLYNQSLDDLNLVLAEQAALLEDTSIAVAGYEADENLSEKTLDNYKTEYEDLVVAYIDNNIKTVKVSRGTDENRSFKNDVDTLKTLLTTAQDAALDADDAKTELAVKTASLKTFVESLPSFWPTTPGAGIYSKFGRRFHPVFHYYKKHEGIDIGDTKGAPIYASGTGTITASEWHSGYGNLIEIDHGNGYSTRYGHCSKLLVTVGQQVKQGEKIGLIGSTGTSTGPHLHFEVRINGTTVDPEMFVTH